MMTMTQARDDLYRLLGMELPETAPSFLPQLVANCFNAATQEIYRESGTYFVSPAEEDTEVEFAAGENTARFPLTSASDVLAVKYNGRSLRKLKDRTQAEHYVGMLNPGAVAGEPEAWFARVIRFNGAYDADEVLLYIAPGAADQPLTVAVETSEPVPHFSDTDIISDEIRIPSPRIDIETIFLPIARIHASRSHYWIMPELLPQYQEDYNRAIATLRSLNPNPRDLLDPEVRPERKEGGE